MENFDFNIVSGFIIRFQDWFWFLGYILLAWVYLKYFYTRNNFD